MKSHHLVSLLAVAAALSLFLYARNGVAPGPSVLVSEPPHREAHFYKDPKISLANVAVKVFYAVPRNKQGEAELNLQSAVVPALEKFVRFHEVQFRGFSKIRYKLFPKPIFLSNENIFYDTENTNRGNPYALLRVAEEIYNRVFLKNGDLYNEEFVKPQEGEYAVMAILYEGVGASGSAIYESNFNSAAEIAKHLGVSEEAVHLVTIKEVEGFFIVNKDFLVKPELSRHGATVLYHEFGHTLGLPDNYNLETNQSFSMDIMGGGREEPIEVAYIDRSFLENMGVAGNEKMKQSENSVIK